MFRTRPAALALVALISLVSAAPVAHARATVRKVDGAVGPYFTVQDAVDASANGDVVLVKSGSYPSAIVDGKSVAILADTSTLPFVTSLEVRNLTAGQRVTIGGIHTNLTPTPFSVQYSVNIHDNAGKVIVQGCSIHGGAPAIRVATCSDVLVTDSDVLGTGAGIGATSANVHVTNCTVTGPTGNPAIFTPFGTIPGGNGHPAISVASGKAIVAGSILQGGDGGAGLDDGMGGCSFPGLGGPGLQLSGVSPFAFLLATSVTGGGNAIGTVPCSGVGAPVPGISAPPGSVVISPELVNRSLHVTTPIREGQTATITVIGNPGEPTVLLLSAQASITDSSGLAGTLLCGAPIAAYSFVTLPPAGVVAFPALIPAGALPAGVGAIEVFAQIIVAGLSGHGVLGSGHEIAILDSLL